MNKSSPGTVVLILLAAAFFTICIATQNPPRKENEPKPDISTPERQRAQGNSVSIHPPLIVLTPADGEKFMAGETLTVKWSPELRTVSWIGLEKTGEKGATNKTAIVLYSAKVYGFPPLFSTNGTWRGLIPLGMDMNGRFRVRVKQYLADDPYGYESPSAVSGVITIKSSR